VTADSWAGFDLVGRVVGVALGVRVFAEGCGVGGGGLRFFWFLRSAHAARAVVALFFYVVVLGQGRDHGGTVGELADAAQDNFGAAVVEFYFSVNLNELSGEAADVADIFQVGGEDDHAEGASHLVLAEVDVVDAFDSSLDAEDFSGDAFVFADVVGGFLDGDAVGAGESQGDGYGKQGYGEGCGSEDLASMVVGRRASPWRDSRGGCRYMVRGRGGREAHSVILGAWEGRGSGWEKLCLRFVPE
jgi:hypothetical protein